MAKKKINNQNRILHLSTSLLEMGVALVNEGEQNNDYSIKQLGNILIFLSAIAINEKDVYDFSELCSLFSSKKLIEQLINNSDIFHTNNLSYQDFLKEIKRFNQIDPNQIDPNQNID
jgi:hypothetical protein